MTCFHISIVTSFSFYLMNQYSYSKANNEARKSLYIWKRDMKRIKVR